MHLNRRQQMVSLALFLVVSTFLIMAHADTAAKGIKNMVLALFQNQSIIAVQHEETERLESDFANDRYWVNYFGLIMRLLGKREVADYAVVKDFEEQLYVPDASYFVDYDMPDAEAVAESVVELSHYCSSINMKLVFVQPPYKNCDTVSELVGYAQPVQEAFFDSVVNLVSKGGVDCLDLRDFSDCCRWYRTDHHWTGEAAFCGAKHIVEHLSETYPDLLDNGDVALLDESRFDLKKYPQSLLGSAGVKVGEYYTGMDDFSYLSPTYKTAFNYTHIIDNNVTARYDGTFDEALIDRDLLSNDEYYNKYNAFLHGGYVENIITNSFTANDSKVVVVSHSYARPMVPYLSILYGETRYIDPQPGRYDQSVMEYIKKYQPDLVIIMYDDVLAL